MKIDFRFDDENGIEMFTDIKDPFTFTAFLSATMHEIKHFLSYEYGADDHFIEPCMICIKDAANMACAGLDDNSDIEEVINQIIERRMKSDAKGATDISI
jgi:hypothetical protein